MPIVPATPTTSSTTCTNGASHNPSDTAWTSASDSLHTAAWTPAYDADRTPRKNADVAELIGLMDLSGWPDGMRVIVRREKPHPGAQLQITDRNG